MIDSPTVSARRYVQLLLYTIRSVRPIAGSVVDRIVPLAWHKLSKLDRPWRFSVARRIASMTHKLKKLFGVDDNPFPSETMVTDQHRTPIVPELRLKEIFRLHTDDWPSSVVAMSAYSPKPLAVPVIHYAAEYGAAPWRRISSDIVAIRLSGNHGEAVSDPTNLAAIANDLRVRLQTRK